MGAPSVQKTEAWLLPLWESATDGIFSLTSPALSIAIRIVRDLVSTGECDLIRSFLRLTTFNCSSPSTPSTKRYSSRPYAICYPPSLYQASHWALRCPKPGMAAPFGECHWEVRSSLSHLLEGDRGPLSHLETSSSSGGTNGSTVSRTFVLPSAFSYDSSS